MCNSIPIESAGTFRTSVLGRENFNTGWVLLNIEPFAVYLDQKKNCTGKLTMQSFDGGKVEYAGRSWNLFEHVAHHAMYGDCRASAGACQIADKPLYFRIVEDFDDKGIDAPGSAFS